MGQRRVPGDHDPALAAAGRERLGSGRAVLPALRVFVVAASGFPSEPPGGDRPDADRGRPPARLAEALLVERARDVEPDVDSDQVHELEQAHAKAAAEPADAVDLLKRGG